MNDSFFSAFGILTAAFARMEADVRTLISGVAFRGDSVVASAFIDNSQLAENLTVLRKLSRQNCDKEDQFREIIKIIESIREKRNLFIHGIWQPGNFGELNGFAKVTDLKTKYERGDKNRTWIHSKTIEFNIQDFQGILDKVKLAIKKIDELCELFNEENDDIQFGQGGMTASLESVIVPMSKV